MLWELASSRVSVCVLKDALSNINHSGKQRWILKCSHDQGYCPRECALPQTASCYKLSPLLPWDFTKLKACCHLFQYLRSLRVPLSKLSVSVKLPWMLMFFWCSCTHCQTALYFLFVFEDNVVRGLPHARWAEQYSMIWLTRLRVWGWRLLCDV